MTATMKDSILLKLLARVGGENSIAHIKKQKKFLPHYMYENNKRAQAHKKKKKINRVGKDSH